MTRVRRRQSRRHTAEGAWLRRREYVIGGHPGDTLAESSEFWANEPDVPVDLRSGLTRYRVLLATDIPHPEIGAERRAEWEDLKARRLAWLSSTATDDAPRPPGTAAN